MAICEGPTLTLTLTLILTLNLTVIGPGTVATCEGPALSPIVFLIVSWDYRTMIVTLAHDHSPSLKASSQRSRNSSTMHLLLGMKPAGFLTNPMSPPRRSMCDVIVNWHMCP